MDKSMHKDKSWAVLLTDLTKAFECIVYDFLIAKLEHTVSHTKPLKLCKITL